MSRRDQRAGVCRKWRPDGPLLGLSSSWRRPFCSAPSCSALLHCGRQLSARSLHRLCRSSRLRALHLHLLGLHYFVLLCCLRSSCGLFARPSVVQWHGCWRLGCFAARLLGFLTPKLQCQRCSSMQLLHPQNRQISGAPVRIP